MLHGGLTYIYFCICTLKYVVIRAIVQRAVDLGTAQKILRLGDTYSATHIRQEVNGNRYRVVENLLSVKDATSWDSPRGLLL